MRVRARRSYPIFESKKVDFLLKECIMKPFELNDKIIV